MLAAARRRVDDGDLELPMNAIAKDAGVGVGTVYRHFPTRQALLEALAWPSLTALAGDAARAAADPDPAAGLLGFLRASLHRLSSDAAAAEVLTAPDAARPETRELSGELLGAVDTLLERARTAGAIRADVTAADLRALMCAVDHAARIAGPAQRDRYLEILVAGLRP
jgi:AcrR family transcriptional regulator